jgi:hypothetical protein
MATTASRVGSSTLAANESPARGRIGLVVLGAIASGLVLGLLFVLVVFGGGPETQVTGSALLALGAGFLLLAAGSTRLTDQPQKWALPPGIGSAGVGLALLGMQRGWVAAQAKLAQLSRNSFHRTAQGATHAALLEDQRFAAITSRAIADVVRATRQDRR